MLASIVFLVLLVALTRGLLALDAAAEVLVGVAESAQPEGKEEDEEDGVEEAEVRDGDVGEPRREGNPTEEKNSG